MNIHMMVGAPKSDLLDGKATPIVAGCIDGVVWEHCDDETLDGLWAAMRERMDPGGDYYEWREVVVELHEIDVMDAFETTVVAGKVTERCSKCGTTGEACPLGDHDQCPYDDPDAMVVVTPETSALEETR